MEVGFFPTKVASLAGKVAIHAGRHIGKIMAGVVGFEPTIHGTKNRCLTTWLHPNGERLSTPLGRALQEGCGKNFAAAQKKYLARLHVVVDTRTAPVRLPDSTSSWALAHPERGNTVWTGELRAPPESAPCRRVTA